MRHPRLYVGGLRFERVDVLNQPLDPANRVAPFIGMKWLGEDGQQYGFVLGEDTLTMLGITIEDGTHTNIDIEAHSLIEGSAPEPQ